MKLGKRFGRLGFVIGFVGSLLFYASPMSFFTFESHFVCPWCPYVDSFNCGRLCWVELGLTSGLVFGLLLALIGFTFGYTASRITHAK
jgi:hypothetical protein